MKHLSVNDIIKLINAVTLAGITLVVTTAYFFQFFYNELPCPLCLLQRVGLLAIGFGFLLNMHFTVRPSHYSMAMIAAIFTAFVSLRQITLHILPGDPGYGSQLFGLHMYTWAFIFCILIIIYLAIILSIPSQYHFGKNPEVVKISKKKMVRVITHSVFVFYLFIVGANVLTTFSECGIQECPDNPENYRLFAPKTFV